MGETMAVLVPLLVVIGMCAYGIYSYYCRMSNMKKEREEWDNIDFDSISYSDLLDLRKKIEREFEEKKSNTNRFNKLSPTELYNKERLKDFKLLHIQAVINSRFSDVITTREELRNRAHSLATDSEKNRIVALEKELESARRGYALSYGSGPQYLEKTHSSVLNGVVGSKICGPITGGLAYAVTESKNEAIRKSNLEKRAHNAVLDDRFNEVKRIEKRLDEEYIDVIKKHDSSVHIEIFEHVYI